MRMMLGTTDKFARKGENPDLSEFRYGFMKDLKMIATDKKL